MASPILGDTGAPHFAARAGASRLELQLLGGFSVRAGGAGLGGFESRKARAVLAHLALQGGRAIGRDRLAELFWPELELDGARRNLRQVLYNLRSVLGHAAARCLVVDAQQLRLAVAGVAVDALEFEATAREGLSGRGPSALAALARALELYRGELLAGLALSDLEAWEEWRDGERERLRELAMAVGREALRRSEADGLHEAALRFAQRLGELDPLSEEACRARMRLLARLGRRAQALAHCSEFVSRLERELDVAPGAEILALRGAIAREAELPGVDAERPGPTGPVVELVGRERAWRELGADWSEVRDGACRLTLVCGPRGAGKTRLARTFIYQALAGSAGTVLLARCPEPAAGAGRALLVDAVASLPVEVLERGRAELVAARAAVVAALPEVLERRRDLGDLPAAPGGDPRRAVANLLRELARPRRARSGERGSPVVLFVDDLERAPEMMQELAALRREVGAGAIWILAAARSDELSASALRRLRRTAEKGGGHALDLDPLNAEDVLRAARALVGESQAEALGAALFAASDGLPLALAEAVNLLADQGALRPEWGGGWSLADPEGLARVLPADLDELIDRRVALLPKTSRRLLGLAAVVGERFDTATLLEVDSEHPAVLEVAMRILIERWLVRPRLASWTAHRRDRDVTIWQAGARHGPFEFAQRTVRDRLAAKIAPARRRVLEAEIERVRARLEAPGERRPVPS